MIHLKRSTRTVALLLTILMVIGATWVLKAYTAPGDLDPTFGDQGRVLLELNRAGDVLAIQPDGKIVTAGGNVDGSLIVRLKSNGSVDQHFGDASGTILVENFIVAKLAILPGGKILAAGQVFGDSTPLSKPAV